MADLLNQLEELYKAGFLPEVEFNKRKEALLATMPDPERDRAKKVFSFFDEDKDSHISMKELQALVFQLGEILTSEQIEHVMQSLDTDCDGVLSFDEFYAWWISDDREHQTETGERMRFLKMKLTSQTYFKNIKHQSKNLQSLGEKTSENSSGDTYRMDMSVDFGNCTRPSAGVHVNYEKNEEKANAFRKRCSSQDLVLAALTLICTPETTQESLAPFIGLLEPAQRELKKEGLPINATSSTLVEENGQKLWRIVALPKPKLNQIVLGILGVVGLKQLDLDLDLSGDKNLDAKLRVNAEISKSATSLFSEIKWEIPDQFKFLFATFGNVTSTFRFKGIGEGFGNDAFQDFLFRDILDLREMKGSAREAITRLLGDNDPAAFMSSLLKEILLYERIDSIWPFYVAGYSIFSGISDLVFVAGEHMLTVKFDVPNAKNYFVPPHIMEEWKRLKEEGKPF